MVIASLAVAVAFLQAPTALPESRPVQPASAQPADAARITMASAASELLAALPSEQRAKVTRAFDDPERTTWSFTRRQREGLYLSEMSEAHRALAMRLVESGLSKEGIERVRLIRMNEENNRTEEAARNEPATYGADLYALLIFGDPSDATKPWGWRFEGHHIGLHFSSLAAETTTTPLFFGAFPAALAAGPHKGSRPLGAVQDAALDLRRRLSPEQAKQATVADGPPADILTGPGRERSLHDGKPVGGIAMADLGAAERDILWALVVRHASDLRGDLASDELRRIKAAGTEGIRFGWAGEPDLAKPHYYRIVGPTFAIEFDCSAGDPNHLHCVWNDPVRNFGDPLREHLERDHRREKPKQ